MTIPKRPAFTKQAACAGTSPSLFFPERGQSNTKAKAICAGCPVREPCLEDALVRGEEFGIWGGLTETERRKIRRERGLVS